MALKLGETKLMCYKTWTQNGTQHGNFLKNTHRGRFDEGKSAQTKGKFRPFGYFCQQN